MCTPMRNSPFPTDPASQRAVEVVQDMFRSGELPPLSEMIPFPEHVIKSSSVEHRVDIAHVSAEISQRLTDWEPLRGKVTQVIGERTFEITPCDHPVSAKDFWQDDCDDAFLSREQKQRLHLQYHRSYGTYGKVLAFVSALEVLCDSGISFHHEGRPVVDIWVSYTSEFDISDILESRILKVIDSVHEMVLPTVNSHERMETLRKIDRKAYRKLGMEAQCSRQSVEYIKQHRPDSYRGSMPHWWVTVITEGPMLSGVTQRAMVHIDVCGAAFDDIGFRKHKGKLVSLQVFTTPEYMLRANKSARKDMKTGILGARKFVMDSGTRSTVNGFDEIIHCPQPYSTRHLRSFIAQDGSSVSNAPSIEVTSLSTFVAQSTQFMPGNFAQWYRIIADMRHSLVLGLPRDAPILIRDLKKRPELNGKSGRMLDSVIRTVTCERVAVSIEGEAAPLSLRTTCVCLTERAQYKSHAEILEQVEKLKPDSSPEKRTSEGKKPTREEEEACQKALLADPSLMKAFKMITSGNVTIASFAAPGIAESMKKLTKPPFDKVLPMEGILNGGLTIADHPKFAEAFKIVTLVNHAKQRVMETNPAMIAGDGSVLLGSGSSFERLVREVAKKIKHDKGLNEVFEMMNDKKLFPNPMEQWGPSNL